ncbi:MAG: hypothetical protein LBC68_03985 [Prevotellaceae bacterium]|jgi:hypothetical protein|nr:hypothetical protein [Prevotellaceae bacterium]
MKKLLLLTFAVLALSLTFTSCSKDDETPETPDSLVGTEWTSTGTYTNTLKFTTETEVTSTYSDDDKVDNGTYEYEKPNVTITYLDEDEGISIEVTLEGVVNGNKMMCGAVTYTRKK